MSMEGNKKQTTIIIICCILSVALIAFLLYRLYKKTNASFNGNSQNNVEVFPLHEGSLGNEVKELQEYLNLKLSSMETTDGIKLVPLKIDGIFGEKTKTACVLIFGTAEISESQFNEI